ncbi:YjbH domain-containing protein [Paraburkholderia acidisoli]|uniref:YjbH domain-containing protein n=1 Tax=Paraburkholderia acidisoli TaxID=2571748 RepID=A0A7Z2GFW7_9BURK|nr:YjbH domain-containing protein [Paraburkholderia acidisoli]QGZ60694.1 YjbH domain-containing protein [Paraburkholderia acidisoli]
MNKDRFPGQRRATYLTTCLIACGLPFPAIAGESLIVTQPMHLGDWLAGRVNAQATAAPQTDNPLYPQGVSWFAHRELALQEAQRQQLLLDIGALRDKDPTRSIARDAVYGLVDARSATGRVSLKSGDGRWLQGNPASDPMLQPGDIVKIPDRPQTVTVIRSTGSLCVIPFQANAEALHYVLACNSHASPDTAWIAQPDGTVSRFNIALWNREQQDAPAPGAWIWAPDRGEQWPDDISQRIATFFATQGVSETDDPRMRPTVDMPVPPPSMAARSRDFPITGGDWGSVGILQTPTARMNPAGEASFSVSTVNPYTRINVMMQPVDFLEFGFRYTDISNQAYGPADWSGSQSYKDKSVDAKLRLWKESAYIPEVSVGVRDLAGTGLFSGEYVVASKRTGDFDWSAGLGWGYVGNRGNLPNPLSIASSRFNNRTGSDGTGTLSNSYFRGRTSLFGGVQYQTPIDKLILKLEYDGNNYQHEPFGETLKDKSPFNVGFVYRATSYLDLSAAFERGSRLMLGFSLHGNFRNAETMKVGDPKPLPITPPPVASKVNMAAPRSELSDVSAANFAPAPTDVKEVDASATPAVANAPATRTLHLQPVVMPEPTQAGDQTQAPIVAPEPATDWHKLADDLYAQMHWRVVSVRRRGEDLLVEFDNPDAFYIQATLDRGANVLNREAPAGIRTFTLQVRQRGMATATYTINRDAWYASHARVVTPSESTPVVVQRPPLTTQQVDGIDQVFAEAPKRFSGSIGPGYAQSFGGPNGFLYEISAVASGEMRLTRTSWIAGAINFDLLDNYGKYKADTVSSLPPVRTDIRQYVTSSRVTIPMLQATKVGRVGESGFYSVYGGLLESMFAGVGAEYLYRPYGSHFAIGIDGNEVQQRGFRQDFSMLSYRTFTGHITAYWDTGWQGIQANVSFGRYLARDVGVTVDVSRRFRNGVTMGAYFTKTNVSSAQFGEGSFDKGIYLSFPFDIMLSRSTGDSGRALWEPLLRDGGAKLNRAYPLYNVTDMSDPRSLWYGPPSIGK